MFCSQFWGSRLQERLGWAVGLCSVGVMWGVWGWRVHFQEGFLTHLIRGSVLFLPGSLSLSFSPRLGLFTAWWSQYGSWRLGQHIPKQREKRYQFNHKPGLELTPCYFPVTIVQSNLIQGGREKKKTRWEDGMDTMHKSM